MAQSHSDALFLSVIRVFMAPGEAWPGSPNLAASSKKAEREVWVRTSPYVAQRISLQRVELPLVNRVGELNHGSCRMGSWTRF
jgi:hypothetical protein